MERKIDELLAALIDAAGAEGHAEATCLAKAGTSQAPQAEEDVNKRGQILAETHTKVLAELVALVAGQVDADDCGRMHYPGNDPENGPAEPCLRPKGHNGRHKGVSNAQGTPS